MVTKELPNESDVLAPIGRRARKAMAVRQALFEAGLAAFERQPIGLVSILDITEAADVAKGVFYLQFRSKDDYLLALWEEVQGRFLGAIRAGVIECRSRTARIDAVAQEFVSFAHDAPAATRFWIRMSSYFPDEIGEPGHLTRIRQEYIQQLAALIAGKTVPDLTPRDMQTSLVMDALCWAIIAVEVHGTGTGLDPQRLVRAVRAALQPSRGAADSTPKPASGRQT